MHLTKTQTPQGGVTFFGPLYTLSASFHAAMLQLKNSILRIPWHLGKNRNFLILLHLFTDNIRYYDILNVKIQGTPPISLIKRIYQSCRN